MWALAESPVNGIHNERGACLLVTPSINLHMDTFLVPFIAYHVLTNLDGTK